MIVVVRMVQYALLEAAKKTNSLIRRHYRCDFESFRYDDSRDGGDTEQVVVNIVAGVATQDYVLMWCVKMVTVRTLAVMGTCCNLVDIDLDLSWMDCLGCFL
jgi:hypothetical protein